VLSFIKKVMGFLTISFSVIICIILIDIQNQEIIQQNSLYASSYCNAKVSINDYTKKSEVYKEVREQIETIEEKKLKADEIYVALNNQVKEQEKKDKEEIKKQERKEEKVKEKEVQTETIDIYKTNPWRIRIPKLNLDAPITEGTTQEALRRTVGHFETTTKWDGNVALAGHNRGYRCNFFQDIKKLKEGDIIVYSTTNGERSYKVVLNKVIEETDWTYLQETQDNRITLITCEENKREYRRCIQGIEIKNELEGKEENEKNNTI